MVLARREAALRIFLSLMLRLGGVVALLLAVLSFGGAGPVDAGLGVPPRVGWQESALHFVRAEGVQLVMVEERGCRFCLKWDQEVGRGYGRTAEGRSAPLHRVRRGAGVLKGLPPVVYTPTFILMRRGEELGRITGYPGQFYFWEELTQLMSAHGIVAGG
mgnify:CR=1 FL=1